MEGDTQAATQKLTQDEFEPRHLHRYKSGLSEEDSSDVFCILHPASRTAIEIVEHTARNKPQHVLRKHNYARSLGHSSTGSGVREWDSADTAQELALRFSSEVVDPAIGFCFGRNKDACDINLDGADVLKRVSNKHFRIYINPDGILMLEDLSSNGTLVDNTSIGGKSRKGNHPKTHMLKTGSVVEIILDPSGEAIKFLLRIPQRDSSEARFMENFQTYMDFQAIAARRKGAGIPMPPGGPRAIFNSQTAGSSRSSSVLHPLPPGANMNYGMHWNGGDNFTCTGVIGKGAFAIVYQIATTWSGELFAAKELEKRRFIKNGVLDTRLANELKIMKGIQHPNIVDYINYVETDTHLYIIMEYVRYGDLAGYVQPRDHEMRTLPEELGREMTKQILTALKYLHDRGITHRDIKPDNILISSEDPFTVKLTDFGLSKMVNNETESVLTTFCGTLLYCAPEVYPQHKENNPSKRMKRRRNENRRFYNQLVDIWSYAAVLWFVLCGKPAFEGITDGNGRAMYERITETPLDTTVLIEQGISDPCIDLLVQMLDIDADTRPSEIDCLEHPWLLEGDLVTQEMRSMHSSRLPSIMEGDEDLDCSQLNISDPPDKDFSDDEDKHAYRGPKRQKGETFYAVRDQTEIPSSSEGSLMFAPLLNDELGNAQLLSLPAEQASGNQRVILEQRPMSLLRSSGVFGTEISFTPLESPLMDVEHDDGPGPISATRDENEQSFAGAEPAVPPGTGLEISLDSAKSEAAASGIPALDGAHEQNLESMVRDLNMVSPGSSIGAPDVRDLNIVSPESSIIGQDVEMTPKPRNVARMGVLNSPDGGKHQQIAKDPTTPKASKINRQINLPVPASFFYDPTDPRTHNLEYASRMMNQQNHCLAESTTTNTNTSPFQNTALASITSSAESQCSPNKENELDNSTLSPPLSIPDFPLPNLSDAFTKPLPVYGKMTSTSSSFASITLILTQRHTTWGRNSHSTIVYKDANDTRIAKTALELWFFAPGIEDQERAGVDWTTVENLHVVVATQASRGISVNGVPLPNRDELGRKCFGTLYSGDEVQVSTAGKGLKFACEFFLGKSMRKRRNPGDGKPRFVVEVDMDEPRSKEVESAGVSAEMGVVAQG